MFKHIFLHAPLRLMLMPLLFKALIATCVAQDALPDTPPVLLQMVRDDMVHQDMKLSSEQIQSLRSILKPIDERWFFSRNLPLTNQKTEVQTLTDELRRKLASILDADQVNRLSQLERQALGTRMVIRKDVTDAIGVSPAERQSLIRAFIKTDEKIAQLQSQLKRGELKEDHLNREIAKAQAAERNVFANLLSTEQRSMLGPLTGHPFDFGKVKRMYPLAPELTSDGVRWIQGGPITLDEMQGKVVAVHYYAYQCINCKRNLPHYKAWHDDYADKGLVIIGIQTPETSSERNFEMVKAAAAADDIEYPVLLDSKSANWKTWHNTMWPTVYLIDKKGFIRRWWQGELNWQGATGEQQLRNTIEQLLAE